MREVKFRVWRSEMHEPFMDYNPSYDAYGECENVTISLILEGKNWMQYTGFKDKHGKEIYELDIFKFYSPSFKITFTKKVEWPFDPTMFDCIGEVIGNIYENPELLNEPRP